MALDLLEINQSINQMSVEANLHLVRNVVCRVMDIVLTGKQENENLKSVQRKVYRVFYKCVDPSR
jgi:hypothetical protein